MTFLRCLVHDMKKTYQSRVPKGIRNHRRAFEAAAVGFGTVAEGGCRADRRDGRLHHELGEQQSGTAGTVLSCHYFLSRRIYPFNTDTLGAKLLMTRRISGLSQKEIGKVLGVDGTTVVRYETGRSKPSDMVLQLYHSYACC